jgi:ribosome-binding factor A
MTLHSRIQRVNEEIRSVLAEAILTELKDPRLANVMVTISRVETSKDLHAAIVWASVLADDEKSAEAVGALNQAKGYLQRYLSKNITLRWLPELEFRLDTTTRYAARINDLLKTIERQPTSGQKDDVPEEQ